MHGGQDEETFRDEVESEIEAYEWELEPKSMRMTGIDKAPVYIDECREQLEKYRRRKAAREKREKERKKSEKKK